MGFMRSGELDIPQSSPECGSAIWSFDNVRNWHVGFAGNSASFEHTTILWQYSQPALMGFEQIQRVDVPT